MSATSRILGEEGEDESDALNAFIARRGNILDLDWVLRCSAETRSHIDALEAEGFEVGRYKKVVGFDVFVVKPRTANLTQGHFIRVIRELGYYAIWLVDAYVYFPENQVLSNGSDTLFGFCWFVPGRP